MALIIIITYEDDPNLTKEEAQYIAESQVEQYEGVARCTVSTSTQLAVAYAN